MALLERNGIKAKKKKEEKSRYLHSISTYASLFQAFIRAWSGGERRSEGRGEISSCLWHSTGTHRYRASLGQSCSAPAKIAQPDEKHD